MLRALGAGLEQKALEPGAERSRWRADSMCESFWMSSQTMSVGRLARRRRPRMRWPVPKASMVTPLVRRIEFARSDAASGVGVQPPDHVLGVRLGQRGSLSASSSLRFSKWAMAWWRVSETIQIYGSRFSSAARRTKASVTSVDLAPPRGPRTLSF